MACIRKRRGRWVVDYRDALGTRRWITRDTKREAEDALGVAVRESRQIARPVVDPEQTLKTYSERWVSLIAPTIKPRTLEGYQEKLRNHVLPALGGIKVRQLHRGAIKALLSARLASGLSTETVRLIHGTIRAMLSAAEEDGIIIGNPARGLGRVLRLVRSRSTRQENIRAFDAGQDAAFLSAVLTTEPRFYPFFLLLARTGLRLGEGLALKWDDVDLEGRDIRVERALSNRGVVDTPKSGHGRSVDASTQLVAVLRELDAQTKAAWLAEGQTRPEWVFATGTRTPCDHANVAKAFKRALKAAKLPPHFHIHCLRHTYASRLLADGASPAYVQEQLGHASIELTVGTYGRWLRKRQPGAVDTLDDPIFESGSKTVANGDPESDALKGYLPQLVDSLPAEMVRPARFERATYRFVVCCSIQLS